jgi:probable HAF family extracellular repeat protein
MKRRLFTTSLVACGLMETAHAADESHEQALASHKPFNFPTYELLRLGTFQGGYSAAYALNSRRGAVGQVGFDIAGGNRPALFAPGQPPRPIYTDGPGSAQGINARGEVVGWFMQGDCAQAFRWRDKENAPETLASLGGGSSRALAINDRSEIVGWSEAVPGASHAMYWWRDRWVDLGTWGGQAAQATAINNRGDVVGFREVLVDGRALPQGVRRLRGQRPKLMPVPPGYDAVVPTSINERGAITGYVYRGQWIEGTRSVFVLDGGQYRVMASERGFLTGGLSINNRGDVAGFNYDGPRDPRYIAQLWLDRGRTPVSPQALIDPPADAAPWRLMEAFAINNAGVVVGHGLYRPAGSTRSTIEAYMLIPKG